MEGATRVEVSVSGVIADVSVTQVYGNSGGPGGPALHIRCPRRRAPPEMLHRIAGTLLYSLSLLGVYLGAESSLGRTAGPRRALPGLVPCAWYLGVTVGVPLAGRACCQDPGAFLAHVGCVGAAAPAVLLLANLPGALRDRLYSRGSAR